MALVAVGLGWFAPVMGVSLLVFLAIDCLLASAGREEAKYAKAAE